MDEGGNSMWNSAFLVVLLGLLACGATEVRSQPVVHVTPGSLTQDLLVGNSAIRTVTVSNSGSANLLFDVSFEGHMGAAPFAGADRPIYQRPMATPPQVDFKSSYSQYRALAIETDAVQRETMDSRTGSAGIAGVAGSSKLDSFVVFSDNMESGGNGWTHTSLHSNGIDRWEQSNLRRNSGVYSWRVSQHDYEGDDALKSPPIDLSRVEVATLSFYHWYNFDDCGDPSFEPDGGIVELSVNGGSSWTKIFPLGGYPYVLDSVCASPLGFQEAYSHDGGVGGAFVPAVYDLTPFVGNVIAVRFRAGWDCGNCGSNEGWFIDDVTVYSTDYVSWLTAVPTSGTVAPGGATNIALTFDASGLIGGQYLADLVVASNDPSTPEVLVPTVLNVTGVPHISISPTAADFGALYIGLSVAETLTVANTGTDDLVVSSITCDNPEFTADSSTLTIPPITSRKLVVTFRPGLAGLRTGTLTLLSNDPLRPASVVSLRGEGRVPPDIAVSPDSLDANLFTGSKEAQTLTIRNLGGLDLLWTLDIERVDVLRTLNYSLSVPLNHPNAGSVDQGGGNSNGSNVPWRTTAVQATLLDLTGVNILFDQYHGNVGGGGWSTMVSDLQNRGATVTYNYSPITSAGLQDVDIFWLVDPYGFPLATSEITALRTWLLAGGGLLIEGDETVGTYNDLLASVGAGITYTSQSPATGVTTTIFPHETTVGVDSLYIEYPLARLSTVVTPAAVLVRDIAGGNNVAYSKVGNGRIIAMTDENFYDGLIGYFDNELFGNQVFDWLARATGFLSVDVDNGTVASGHASEVTVTFDATGLNGGDYLADLLIKSNDPDEPEVRVPAHLRVTGAPDITVSPDSINFGSVFVGFPATDTVVVKNIGTDQLSVSNVSSSNTDFVPGTASFTLNPGGQTKIPIAFTPSVPGSISGVLTLTSNDPDRPEATVALKGLGLIPPDIAVAPDSLDADLFTGAKEDQILTIRNLGGSDLFWRLDIERVDVLKTFNYSLSVPLNRPNAGSVDQGGSNQDSTSVPWRTTAVQATLLDLTGVNVLFDQSHGNVGSYDWSYLIGDLQSRGATVTNNYSAITSALLQDVDILWLVDLYGSPLATSEITALRTWLLAGGGLLIEGDETLDSYNALLASVGAGITYIPGGSDGTTTTIFPHETTVGVNSIYISSALARLSPVVAPAGVLVRDVSGGNNVAYSTVGSGRIIAVANEDFVNGYIGAADNQLFGNQAFDWLSKATGFVSVNIDSGTVATGSSTDVTVTFDATGLNGGDYLADLSVRSNDPDEPEVRVPAHLHVTGAPDITVSPDSINFGSVFIGYSSADTVTVRNVGTDQLSVTSISSNKSDFVPGTTSFSLSPGAQIKVAVTFTPGMPSPISGMLTLASNDPDMPAATVVLKGQGLIPPDIAVTPDSLDEDLLSGQTSTQQLTITNSGGSDLVLDVSSRFVSGLGAPPPLSSQASLRDRLDANHESTSNNQTTQTDSLQPRQSVSAAQSPPARAEMLSAGVDIAGLYTGDYLSFGISNYGEIMPFQFPVGNEHLELGTYLSGYTVAYRVSGMDYIASAAYYNRYGIMPVSYREIVNNASSLIVEVVTRTGDNLITLTHTFTFDRHDKYVSILTSIANTSAGTVTDVVFKSFADWDTDGTYDDNWDYDLSRNMIYAWKTNYTAIASNRVPDLMDIYGWDDYGQRSTYVNYPTGPVYGIDGLEILHFALGNLAGGSNVLVGTTYGAGSTLVDLQSVIDRGTRFVNWLDIDPNTAVIPAGTSRIFDVMFDATGLNGGDYLADLLVSSNDPDELQVRVPAHLHVTGVPDIDAEPNSLAFGNVFIGQSIRDTIVVSNRGTDLLTVSSITTGSAHFSAGPNNLSLAPGQSRPVEVVFSPGIEGNLAAFLRIASNDPDEALINLPLSGRGIFPPEIHVSPGSLEAFILQAVDPIEEDTLIISNSGRSDLIWTTKFSAASRKDSALFTLTLPAGSSSSRLPNEPTQYPGLKPPARTSPLHVFLDDLSGVKILFDASHGNSGDISSWSTIVANVLSRGATVSVNYSTFTTALLADVDIVWLIDQSYSWAPAEIDALHDWMMAGGGLLLEGDQTIETYNTILASLGAGITYTPESPVTGITTDILPHETTVGVSAIYIDYPLVRLSTVTAPASVLVRDFAGGNNVAYSLVGNGRIIAMADENFTDWSIGVADNQLFANQVFDWLASRIDWLTITPASDTTLAGMTSTVVVTMDGSKAAPGDYYAVIAIESNDPVTPIWEVPVAIHIQEYICGDANANGVADRADIDYIVRYYFRYGPAPIPLDAGDMNCDGLINLSDICAFGRFLNGTWTPNCCQNK